MSEKYEFSSDANVRELSLSEASDLLRGLAGDRRADESVKAVLRRVSRRLRGWSGSRVRAIWYRDARVRLRSDEVEELRALAGQRAEKDAHDELSELRERIARLETLLAVSDEAFHSAHIAALRAQRREVG